MSLPALFLSAAMVGLSPNAAVVASEGICKSKVLFPASQCYGMEVRKTENDESSEEEGATFQLLQTSVELGAKQEAETDGRTQAIVLPETELELSGSGSFVKARSEFTGHSRQCPWSRETCCQDTFCTCPYGSQPVVIDGCYTCSCPQYGCGGTTGYPMCPVDPAFCTYDVGCGCPSGHVRVGYVVYGSYCLQCAPMSPTYSVPPTYNVNVTYHVHAKKNSKEDEDDEESPEEEDEDDEKDEDEETVTTTEAAATVTRTIILTEPFTPSITTTTATVATSATTIRTSTPTSATTATTLTTTMPTVEASTATTTTVDAAKTTTGTAETLREAAATPTGAAGTEAAQTTTNTAT